MTGACSQKERAYREFVKLPLYEDMAPWNIVFQGQGLDYIDYDTKDKTFSKVGGRLSSLSQPASCRSVDALFSFDPPTRWSRWRTRSCLCS